MKRTATWATFIGIVAVIATLMWAAPYQQSRAGTMASPVSNPPVGTAGRDGANEPDESPATLHDLETVTGTVDPHELIGRTVDFHVKVAAINNDTSFWVSNQDNRMLVVRHGTPSPNDTTRPAPGQMVHITGTIEGVPNAEARSSWGLKDSQRWTLNDEKVYIRAEHVTPEG